MFRYPSKPVARNRSPCSSFSKCVTAMIGVPAMLWLVRSPFRTPNPYKCVMLMSQRIRLGRSAFAIASPAGPFNAGIAVQPSAKREQHHVHVDIAIVNHQDRGVHVKTSSLRSNAARSVSSNQQIHVRAFRQIASRPWQLQDELAPCSRSVALSAHTAAVKFA